MSELERITYEIHDEIAEQLCCSEVDNAEENEYIMGMAELEAKREWYTPIYGENDYE